MTEGSQFVEILLFAMVAAFLVFRLRSVLGRRTGEERRRPNPFATPDQAAASRVERVIGHGRSVTVGLGQVSAAMPGFDEAHFLAGARTAFAMIVDAYARGDATALRPLLSDTVFGHFNDAIRAHQQAGERLETRIVDLAQAEIVEAGVEGREARVTVKFVSRQINVVRAADGTVVDGHPDEAVDITDLWTFARNVRSTDPNWTLAETHGNH